MAPARATVLAAMLALAGSHASAAAPSSWTNARVLRWARELPLPEATAESFAVRLKDEEITGEVLLTLEKDELRELGLTKMGHLKSVGAAIAKLAAQPPPDERPDERKTVVPPAEDDRARVAEAKAQALAAELEREKEARHRAELEKEKEKDARHQAELDKEREARRHVELGSAERQMEAQRAAERERESAGERAARERAEVRNSNDRYDTRADRADSADRRAAGHEQHMEREAAADRAHEERSEVRHAHGMEREANSQRQHAASVATFWRHSLTTPEGLGQALFGWWRVAAGIGFIWELLLLGARADLGLEDKLVRALGAVGLTTLPYVVAYCLGPFSVLLKEDASWFQTPGQPIGPLWCFFGWYHIALIGMTVWELCEKNKEASKKS
eukprot:COSAG04_NODE_4425_length_2100_cov_2.248376_2_plen_389_part_00